MTEEQGERFESDEERERAEGEPDVEGHRLEAGRAEAGRAEAGRMAEDDDRMEG
jgi:hypothetical protein